VGSRIIVLVRLEVIDVSKRKNRASRGCGLIHPQLKTNRRVFGVGVEGGDEEKRSWRPSPKMRSFVGLLVLGSGLLWYS